MSGSFVTTAAAYDQHVESLRGGLGLLVMNDQAGRGTLATTTVSGMYSHQQPITRKFSLRAALQVTYLQKALDWSKLTFGDMIDPRRGFIYETQDIPRGGTVQAADFSAGLLGFSDKVYGGVAVHHLNEPNESLVLGVSRLPMKYTVHLGSVIPIQKSARGVEASVSPNFRDAFIATLGIETDLVRFGYSYDLTVSELTPATGGAHEVSFSLQFDCRAKRSTLRRAPNCPAF
jgi:type IX secretion system PorP/SprF family membrane protein